MIRNTVELLTSLDKGLNGVIASPSQPNHAALGIAFGRLCTAEVDDLVNEANEAAVTEIQRLIGEADHYVFVMLDGFGMNFVDTLPESSFIKGNTVLEMLSVFPTSTGPNLMSIATGRFPGAHGNLGWNVHIPRLGERITSLRWCRTSDGADLTGIGFRPDELLCAPMINFGARRTYTHITDSQSVDTPWSSITSQDSTLGYTEGEGAIESVVETVRDVLDRASGQTFTYVYWPEVDHTAHEHGVTHPFTRRAVASADALVESLASEFSSRATVVATADHGHLDAGESAYFVIGMDDVMRDLVVAPPAGEQRMLYFHARPGRDVALAAELMARFNHRFAVFRGPDAIESGLLGPPSEITDDVRARVGDFVAISRGKWAMSFPDDPNEPGIMASTHGGITDSETRVPLVVCR